MPELPEVETVVRTLAPLVLDRVFTKVQVLLPASVHPLSMPLHCLTGMRVAGAWRRGKLAILDLLPTSSKKGSCPEYLIFHLRMTGRLITDSVQESARKHSRCIFNLVQDDGGENKLFFDDTRTFGKVFAATKSLLEEWPFWRDLGPEPLEMDNQTLACRLKGARALKTALLDQKTIAGIGNIYADEALFQARLDPRRPAGSLNGEECARLLAAIHDVLRRSIAQCGSSIKDYRDANGNVGSFQNSFAAYGRGGEKCLNCGGELQKIRIGGRATVFCPVCQK